MKGLLEAVTSNKVLLKPTVTKGGEANLCLLESDENLQKEDATRREYFFQAGVDNWYSNIQDKTFPSEFIPLTKAEAQFIIDYWNNITSKSNDPIEHIPPELEDLAQRINSIIQTSFSSYSSVFIKLSTRSPKDSKTIFRKAEVAFLSRLDQDGNVRGFERSSRDNNRLVAFSEEMAKANAITNGFEAVTILLDSWRVAEDLIYAFEHSNEKESDVKDFPISVVIRGWDHRITPKCEFRGFVWNYHLNAIGQYWHSLYYPDLQDLKEKIASDCLTFFEGIKDFLPVPNAMLDLAWLGNGEVILIEVNPLMEGLGSFKGSTGLFDYYADKDILTGKAPFEIRVRDKEESRAELISHMSTEWRKTVYGF